MNCSATRGFKFWRIRDPSRRAGGGAIIYSCCSILESIARPGQISEIAGIVYSTSSAVTHFSAYPQYDLATSAHNLTHSDGHSVLRCATLPRFGALGGCSNDLFLPNHASWKKLMVQSCTHTSSLYKL